MQTVFSLFLNLVKLNLHSIRHAMTSTHVNSTVQGNRNDGQQNNGADRANWKNIEAIACRNGKIHILRKDDKNSLFVEEDLNIGGAHSSYVESVAFSPDGSRIVSGSADNSIKVWNVSTGICERTLNGHSRYVWSVAFSPDGSRIVSGSEDFSIKVWNVSTGTCERTLEHGEHVVSISFSDDGSQLISKSVSSCKIWNVANGSCVDTIPSSSVSNNSSFF